MLTEKEIKILSLLADEKPHTAEEVWSLFGIDQWKKTEKWISFLCETNYVSREKKNLIHQDLIVILPPGNAALEAYAHAAAEEEAKKAEKNAAEAIRLRERAEDQAINKKHHVEQISVDIAIAIFSFIAGFIIGKFT